MQYLMANRSSSTQGSKQVDIRYPHVCYSVNIHIQSQLTSTRTQVGKLALISLIFNRFEQNLVCSWGNIDVHIVYYLHEFPA